MVLPEKMEVSGEINERFFVGHSLRAKKQSALLASSE
jgi:hypothetical protein